MAERRQDREGNTQEARDEARKKGQVAKSADLNGAVVLLAALFALSALGPEDAAATLEARRCAASLAADRARRGRRASEGVGAAAHERVGTAIGPAVAPIAGRRAWSPASSPTSPRSASSRHADGAQARLQEAQPDVGRQEPVRPARRCSRPASTSPRSSSSARSPRIAVLPEARRARRARRHAARRSCCPTLARDGPRASPSARRSPTC